MKSKNHQLLVRRMIAEDEASLTRLGKLIASAHGYHPVAGEPNRKLDEDLQLEKSCFERGLEGLRLKLDAMTDCLEHKNVVESVSNRRSYPPAPLH